jgi:PAS domain S-box-containing protein
MELYPAHFAERLVSGMSDAIVYADAEGVIRVWNRGATRVFGFAEAEAVGRSLDIIIPENLRERHWQGYRATMRTGQSRYRDGQILSVPAVRKDGTRVSVEFTIVPFSDDAGRMIGIAAIMRDATARFEELRALRRQLALHPAVNRTDNGNSPRAGENPARYPRPDLRTSSVAVEPGNYVGPHGRMRLPPDENSEML